MFDVIFRWTHNMLLLYAIRLTVYATCWVPRSRMVWKQESPRYSLQMLGEATSNPYILLNLGAMRHFTDHIALYIFLGKVWRGYSWFCATCQEVVAIVLFKYDSNDCAVVLAFVTERATYIRLIANYGYSSHCAEIHRPGCLWYQSELM
jgi:hypothetical protein